MPRITEIKHRRGTAASWTSANPVLGLGESGWETDTNRIKIGDGVKNWATLPYFKGGGPLDASSHYVSPRFGKFWYPALANKTKPVVAAVGDSITKKFNASSIANSWVGRLRANLQTAKGDGGSGFMGMADFGVTGSTWLSGFWDQYADIDRVKSNSMSWTLSSSQPFSFQGPGWTMAASSTVGANLEWNGMRGTTVSVTILGLAATTGGGTYKVSIDGVDTGGTFTTINKGVDAPYKQVVTTSAIAGAKKIVLTILSGGVNVFGAQAENASGVLVNTFARGGMKSSYVAAGTDYGGKWNGGVSNPCDLLIFAMGVNDMVDTDVGNFVAGSAQRKFVDKVREGSDCDVLFVCQHAGSRDDLKNYHDIMARQREIVMAYDGALVNMWARYNNTWGQANLSSYWGSATTIGVAGSDTLHPGDTGHQLIYNEVKPIVNP